MLTNPEFLLLKSIRDEGPTWTSELARRLGLRHPGHLGARVIKLVNSKKYLDYVPSNAERFGNLIILTDLGRSELSKFEESLRV